jgi:hypothetical protein
MPKENAMRLDDETVAGILDGSISPGRSGRGLREVAEALTPRIAPREAHRAQLKHAMLREFRRQNAAALVDTLDVDASVETRPLTGHAPVAFVSEGVRIDVADLDPVDARESLDDLALVISLAGEAATHKRTR